MNYHHEHTIFSIEVDKATSNDKPRRRKTKQKRCALHPHILSVPSGNALGESFSFLFFFFIKNKKRGLCVFHILHDAAFFWCVCLCVCVSCITSTLSCHHLEDSPHFAKAQALVQVRSPAALQQVADLLRPLRVQGRPFPFVHHSTVKVWPFQA